MYICMYMCVYVCVYICIYIYIYIYHISYDITPAPSAEGEDGEIGADRLPEMPHLQRQLPVPNIVPQRGPGALDEYCY